MLHELHNPLPLPTGKPATVGGPWRWNFAMETKESVGQYTTERFGIHTIARIGAADLRFEFVDGLPKATVVEEQSRSKVGLREPEVGIDRHRLRIDVKVLPTPITAMIRMASRRTEVGHRLSVRAAHRTSPEGPLAATRRLGRGRRSWHLLLRIVLRLPRSLALSTLPLQTMAVGAVLGVEPLTARKTACVRIGARRLGLSPGIVSARRLARRADHDRRHAVMAFYNVWSRPFMQSSSALGYLTVGMGAGAAALIATEP